MLLLLFLMLLILPLLLLPLLPVFLLQDVLVAAAGAGMVGLILLTLLPQEVVVEVTLVWMCLLRGRWVAL